MDSMKSLNISLPRPPAKAQQPSRPSEELLQSFKNAALSVTNLYRAAEVSERRGVQSGYQDALDDLLAFLDKENIGLGDGEGWRIRQWATERLDDQPSPQPGSDSEDDKADHTRPTNHDRPVDQQMNASDHEMSLSAPRQSSEPRDEPGFEPPRDPATNTTEVFTFRSPQQLAAESGPKSPTNLDIPSSNMQNSMTSQATPSVTVNLHPRGTKPYKINRQLPRSSALRNLGSGAGSKRRAPFSEYFDFTELGSAKKGKPN